MSSIPLKTQIAESVKQAMKAGEKRRVAALRLVMAEIKRVEVDERIELDDARVITLLDRMLKQRRDSLDHFERAARDDLAEQERFEIATIQAFLPTPLTQQEIAALIDEALGQLTVSGPQAMGAVMAWLKPRVQGRAEMASVSAAVKARLSG
ncbi:MAG TPA: GatB/YqeY domain-containing protein [Pseudomonadales bacterium]|jgi:uncharacterized protein YqeY|nr:GatB/YqeY domain-containing protein [Pseudomonadales bacterium]HMW14181.1 GatB/YqeY domain-containing protein [Pseudomonadales bacterium]HMW82962.1 GatB/YqeY domain-containing protein [Pseudomonadales bacterium]HMY96749.1 GatB/YqeY domain-containing protein [Pseudomonadales bacterium]HMZ70231.1 GatB/YqeY domain-containing protein [Pseudomonadales bacterium]